MIREAALEYLEGREYLEQAKKLSIKEIAKKFERSDNTIRIVLAGQEVEDIDPIEAGLIKDCYAECLRCREEWKKRTTTALGKKHSVRHGPIKRWAESIQQEQKPSRGSF